MIKQRLTERDVLHVYSVLLKHAQKNFSKREYSQSLDYLKVAAKWAYNFNYFYTDAIAESLLKQISKTCLKNISIDISHSEKRFVLLDSFCWDNRGLTQQYLRAMMSMNADILYLQTGGDFSGGQDIIRELSEYKKAKVYSSEKFPKNDIERACILIEQIQAFAPSKIFLHLSPWEVVALMVCHSINGPVKYNINLTDHAYWMGSSFIDYNIEFRGYGRTVSLEKRGLKPEQLLALPYYPIESKSAEFQGFLSLKEGTVKLFTGGSLYKMMGKQDIFFRMMDDILDLSTNAVILVAGFNSSSTFEQKRAEMKHGDRVITIGIRRDINAVFAHCDIYLGTYPFSGGLMSQYAAMNKKPIIAYAESNDVVNRVEGVINHFQDGVKTYSDWSAMLDYADRLIHNKKFRLEEGEKNNQALMTPDLFNKTFEEIISTNKMLWNWNLEKIDYKSFANYYLELENNYLHSGMKSLVGHMKLKMLCLFPSFMGVIMSLMWRLLLNEYYKRRC